MIRSRYAARPGDLVPAMVAVLLAAAGCGSGDEGKGGHERTGGEGSAAPMIREVPKAAAHVNLFVMSKCPYGMQAAGEAIRAARELGESASLQIDYIGEIGEDGELSSMHGTPEVVGDEAQLCAADLFPDRRLDFVLCASEDWRSIPGNWKECARRLGLDERRLGECIEGGRGEALARASFGRSAEAGAVASPTILVNGKEHRGSRRSRDLLLAMCGAMDKRDRHRACLEIPAAPEVRAIALTDARCGEPCELEPVIQSLRQVFAGLEPRVLDWEDAEARAIYDEAGLGALPAVLFDETLERDRMGAEQMERWLDPAGRYRSLRLGASFDPTAEICDNGRDDTGDGLADCDDPACASAIACRPRIPGRLDLFVMSQCPYGVMALDAMKEVLAAFGDDMTFAVHYIAGERDGEIASMHGPPEVAEDIRGLCAAKLHPGGEHLKYVWCRNRDIQSDDWRACAVGGIDASEIERCASGEEGRALLIEDSKLARDLGIGASPTWLVNNRETFHGLAPADVQKQFCARNPKLAGCRKELSTAPVRAGTPAGGSCGS